MQRVIYSVFNCNGRRFPARWFHIATACPPIILAHFVERATYIGQLELLAAVLPYTSLPELLRGRRVIHWIDNTSALAGLIKGYSSKPDSAFIIHAFHALNVGLRCRVWFEWVASKANIADLPSRGELADLRRRGSIELEPVWPAMDSWESASEEWVATGLGSAVGRHRPAPAGESVRRVRRRKR